MENQHERQCGGKAILYKLAEKDFSDATALKCRKENKLVF